MHYELYLDSLFLLNFGMNLLLLCLVDHSMGHTATWYRLLAGAGGRSGLVSVSFFMERNSRREAVALFSAGDNTYAVCDISHSQPWDVVELFPKTDAVHLPDRRHSGGTASGIPDGKKLSAWDRYDPGSRSILRLDTCVGGAKRKRNKPAIVR